VKIGREVTRAPDQLEVEAKAEDPTVVLDGHARA
jgi:hypothetical protein